LLSIPACVFRTQVSLAFFRTQVDCAAIIAVRGKTAKSAAQAARGDMQPTGNRLPDLLPPSQLDRLSALLAPDLIG